MTDQEIKIEDAAIALRFAAEDLLVRMNQIYHIAAGRSPSDFFRLKCNFKSYKEEEKKARKAIESYLKALDC